MVGNSPINSGNNPFVREATLDGKQNLALLGDAILKKCSRSSIDSGEDLLKRAMSEYRCEVEFGVNGLCIRVISPFKFVAASELGKADNPATASAMEYFKDTLPLVLLHRHTSVEEADTFYQLCLDLSRTGCRFVAQTDFPNTMNRLEELYSKGNPQGFIVPVKRQ